MGIAISGLALYALVIVIGIYRGSNFISPAGLLMPFGVTAIIYQQGGGFSFNIADFYMIMAVVATILFGSMYYKQLVMPRYALLPLAIGAFALVWAIFPPRLFAGQVLTFSLTGEVGQRVGPFGSTLVSVRPTATNISQFLYLSIFLTFYVFFRRVMQRHGAERLVSMLRFAAVTNLLLCSLNIGGGGDLLEPFRTADRRILTDTAVAGIMRVTGGFPEASRLGDFTMPIGAFFSARYFFSGGRGNLFLGLGSFAMGLLSLSSTAIIGFTVSTTVLIMQILLTRAADQGRSQVRLIVSFFIVLLLITAVVASNATLLSELLQRLLFDKSSSTSGLERSAWTLQGFRVFWETYGMGAGTGSARSNGLLAVVMANLGVIGLMLMIGLILPAFTTRGSGSSLEKAGTNALLTLIGLKMISQTDLSLGISFALLLALTRQAKEGLKTVDFFDTSQPISPEDN